MQLQRSLRKNDLRLKPRTIQLIDKLAEVVSLQQTKVLCMGCRNRAELDYFHHKGVADVVGIDLFSEDPDILVMDMHYLQFPDNTFDVVYSSHSLEHACDPRQVINEMARVCRSGGVVVVEVPINYEVTSTDLVDFGGYQNIHKEFVFCLKETLWSENLPSQNNSTEVARTIMRLV